MAFDHKEEKQIMKQRNIYRFTKVMIWITVLMFGLLTVESWIYYKEKIDEVPYRIMLVLQNIIGGFAFKPEIKLKEAYELYSKYTGEHICFMRCITYTYGISVFGANFCTLVWAYKIFEKILRITYIGGWFIKYRNHVIIFGYNDDVKMLLKGSSKFRKEKKFAVHLVCADEIKTSELYALRKNRIYIHKFDISKAANEDIKVFLKNIKANNAGYLILFDDSSMRNFTAFQAFCSEENRKLISPNAKVYCRCEDQSIEELIEKYYDQNKKNDEMFDIETFSIPELQVRKMFEVKNLHTKYIEGAKKNEKWDVNVLIVGFGKLGQQALMQIMNLAVVDSENRINVDIIDYKVKAKVGIFANCLRISDFDLIQYDNVINQKSIFGESGIKPMTYKMSDKVADCPMTINFIDMDIHDQTFRKMVDVGNSLSENNDYSTMPYTYVIVAIDDSNVAIHCAREISCSAHDYNVKCVPVMLRVDSDRQTRKYIKNQILGKEKEKQQLFDNVELIPSPEEVLSLDTLINRELDKKAKLFNYFYSSINVMSKEKKKDAVEEAGKNNEGKSSIIDLKEAVSKWKKLDYYKRASNKALALYYELVFKVQDNKKNVEALKDLFESQNGNWYIKCNDIDEFAEKLKDNKLIHEHCKTEHRRWCFSMIAKGWDYGEVFFDPNGKEITKDVYWHKHSCLVPFDKLSENIITKSTLPYDAMKLMLYSVEKGTNTEKPI